MYNAGTWRLDDDRHAQQWVHGRVVLEQHARHERSAQLLPLEYVENWCCELA